MARAFVDSYAKMGTPSCFFSLVPDSSRMEWSIDNVLNHIKHQFLEGNGMVPGFVPMPTSAPSNDESAARPELRLCSWLDSGAKSRIKVPDAVVQRWKNHPQFARAFDETVPADIIESNASVDRPLKRAKLEDALQKPKTETTAVKEEPSMLASDDLKAHWNSSVRVAVPGLAGMVLAFYNDSIYLYNDTDCTLTMKRGAIIAQFYRGKWATGFQNMDDDSKLKCIPFCLTGSDDLVMVGQHVCPLGAVMEDARLKDPLKAKLAYHDLVENSVPGQVFAFTTTVKHRHAWKGEAGDVQPSAWGRPCHQGLRWMGASREMGTLNHGLDLDHEMDPEGAHAFEAGGCNEA